MNRFAVYILKTLRKSYKKIFKAKSICDLYCEKEPDKVSKIIYDKLMNDNPCMITRFGSNELLCLVTYLGIKKNKRNIFTYITGKTDAWWWNEQNLKNMYYVAGFFPTTIDKLQQFCELMLKDIPEVDILGSWLKNELIFEKELENCYRVDFELLNPYFTSLPWTKALEGKKVLVVHPFNKTIESQYKKRELLFKNNILPDFELKTIKAIQSYAGEETEFKDWFEALEYMKAEIDKVDFDICLIGAGAYGFPLAAYVKRKGKKAIHLAGSLQLLFGIKGKRWENKNYNLLYNYSVLMNEHWVYPGKETKPQNANAVEGACYW